MRCSGVIKDINSELKIGRFSVEKNIGTLTFEDIYYKHIDEMNKEEKELFKRAEPYYR